MCAWGEEWGPSATLFATLKHTMHSPMKLKDSRVSTGGTGTNVAARAPPASCGNGDPRAPSEGREEFGCFVNPQSLL